MHLDKKIFELKQKHKDIFHIDIDGENFIFRPLTKSEYDDFVLNPNLFEDYKAEKVCEICVLHPEDYDFYDPRYAGIPETLSDKIIERSGFSDSKFVERLLKEYRNANENDKHRQIENTIIGVFPEISLGDLDHMNVYETLDLYSRAEWIINNLDQSLIHPEVVKMRREEQQEQESQHQFKNNLNADSMPKHWQVDSDKLKEQQSQEDGAPGMMSMQTLGGATMEVPKRNMQSDGQQ